MVITLVIATCAVIVGIRIRWISPSAKASLPSEPNAGAHVRTDLWQIVAACAAVAGVLVALMGLIWA